MLSRKTASTLRPKKHSKTFTGCWTCRARKVKCDELRPCCRQCVQQGLECGGYDVRLQWTEPETGDPDSAPSASRLVPAKCHRSRVTLAPWLEVIHSHQIDSIMKVLDSVRSSKSEPGAGAELSLQYFGVFDSNATSEDTTSALPTPPSVPHVDVQETSLDAYPESRSWYDPAFLLSDFPGADDALQRPFLDPLSDQSLQFEDNDFDELPAEAFEGLSTSDPWATKSNNAQPNEHSDSSSNSELCPTPLSSAIVQAPLPPGFDNQQRFLLHHYANRVVHLFTALENAKSPWKTIHLPRALQSAGEIVVKGSTTSAKNGLRHALLSISAFSLSNDYRTQDHHPEADKWSRVASVYHGKAINDLQELVHSGLEGKRRPKYKEALATMLSMVSINVYSGNTETCAMHLDGAHQLILQTKKWKTKYSNKALGLHRIYFYLRTIYQSTALTREKPCSRIWRSDAFTDCSLSSIDRETGSPCPSSTLFSMHPSTDVCTHALLYGVPYDLLILLNKTVDLVNSVIEERARTSSRALSAQLATLCNQHEEALMAWEPENIPQVVTPDSPSAETNATIITLMTRAFHQAVVIYFAQHVRLFAHYYMQPYIHKVIDSIEAIERIKAETEVLAAPLYWPAFIAASEAFDPDLQDRFRKWYEQVEAYGIGIGRTGFGVLSEVWERGPCRGETLTSIWRLVVQDHGTVLLLSWFG